MPHKSMPHQVEVKTYPELRYEVTIKRSLSMYILCEWTGFSRSTLSQRLNNQQPWTTTEMFSIIDHLGLKDEDILRLFPRNGGIKS